LALGNWRVGTCVGRPPELGIEEVGGYADSETRFEIPLAYEHVFVYAVSVLDRLRRLHGEVADLTQAFDPALVEGSAAKTLVEVSAQVIKMLVAFQALAARRVEAGNAYGCADRSAAEWFARIAGLPVGEANALLSAARRLGELPTAEEAFRAGHLSPAQAKEVAAGATADPSAEAELVDMAKKGDVGRLAKRSRQVRQNARGEDDAARAARLHAQRSAHRPGRAAARSHP